MNLPLCTAVHSVACGRLERFKVGEIISIPKTRNAGAFGEGFIWGSFLTLRKWPKKCCYFFPL
jgi:hypothetical protein